MGMMEKGDLSLLVTYKIVRKTIQFPRGLAEEGQGRSTGFYTLRTNNLE